MAEHGTVEEENWVAKKMGHSKTVSKKYYEGNAACGIAAKAVDAINKAGKESIKKRKKLKEKLKHNVI